MRFSLTYSGALPARGTPDVKDRIRQQLHPQLQELWKHDPLSIHPQYLQPARPDGISVLTEIGGHVYAPLVCSNLHLLAELDILMLRPELPGGIVTSGGDIDNKLKTLFDALGVPTSSQLAAQSTAPTSTAASPTFTLLEDDNLIAKVSVDTDRLLAPPAPDHVQLLIRVSLRARRLILGNMNLIY